MEDTPQRPGPAQEKGYRQPTAAQTSTQQAKGSVLRSHCASGGLGTSRRVCPRALDRGTPPVCFNPPRPLRVSLLTPLVSSSLCRDLCLDLSLGWPRRFCCSVVGRLWVPLSTLILHQSFPGTGCSLYRISVAQIRQHHICGQFS